MYICKLFTRTLQDDNKAVGYFEAIVTIPQELFDQSGDKLALVKHTISMHLASHVIDTEVPAEYWNAEIARPLQTAFNLPAILQMKV